MPFKLNEIGKLVQNIESEIPVALLRVGNAAKIIIDCVMGSKINLGVRANKLTPASQT